MITRGATFQLGSQEQTLGAAPARAAEDRPAENPTIKAVDVSITPDDMAVVKRCLEGSEAACTELFHRYYGQLMPICMRYARNKEEAKDLLQEGFLRIFNNLATYKATGSFVGWMKRVMVNTAINHYHALGAERNYVSMEDLDSGDAYALGLAPENVFSRFSMDDLLELVQQLPPVYRMVFNLRVMEGWKHEEIAKELGISTGASKSNLNRARMNLMDKLIRRDPSLISKLKGHGK